VVCVTSQIADVRFRGRLVSAADSEWFDVSGVMVIGFLSGLRLNGNLNLKVEEI
jgi:hypothetical protein